MRRHGHHGHRAANQLPPAGLLQMVEQPGRGLGRVVAGRHRDDQLVGRVHRGLPVLRPHVVAGVDQDQFVEPAHHLADLAEGAWRSASRRRSPPRQRRAHRTPRHPARAHRRRARRRGPPPCAEAVRDRAAGPGRYGRARRAGPACPACPGSRCCPRPARTRPGSGRRSSPSISVATVLPAPPLGLTTVIWRSPPNSAPYGGEVRSAVPLAPVGAQADQPECAPTGGRPHAGGGHPFAWPDGAAGGELLGSRDRVDAGRTSHLLVRVDRAGVFVHVLGVRRSLSGASARVGRRLMLRCRLMLDSAGCGTRWPTVGGASIGVVLPHPAAGAAAVDRWLAPRRMRGEVG